MSHSDSEELASTLNDNYVQISIPVKYEAGLIFSVWVIRLISFHNNPTFINWTQTWSQMIDRVALYLLCVNR